LAALGMTAPALVNAVHARSRVARVLADALLVCALVLAGAAYHAARHERVRPDDVSRVALGRRAVVEASVIESRTTASGRHRVVARCRSVSAGDDRGPPEPCSGLAWLDWPEERSAPGRGDLVLATGRLEAPRGPRNPAAFDFRRYLRNRGIHAVLHVEAAGVLPKPSGPERLAAWIRARVEARLGARAGALLLGLLLGETGGIAPDLLDALRRTGTVHVTAVSGLHVGFIVLIAYTLLRVARVPPRAARLLVLPILAGFVLVVGPRASVLRACVMATSLIVSASLERRVHPLNALGVAALALVVARPGVVSDLGFELSFAAAAGIALLFEPIRATLRSALARLGRPGRRPADALAVSLAAQAGVAPLLVALFGEVALAAPLANLVVVPAAAFGVSSGLAMLVAEAIAPPLAAVFAGSAWAAMAAIEWVTSRLAAAPWAAVPVAAAYWPSLLALPAGLAVAARTAGRPRRWAAGCTLAAVAALAACATSFGPGRSHPRAIFFDVGQGDAVLLEIPRRRYVLVDAGPGGAGGKRRDAGRDVLLPYLRRNAIVRLDAVVITHGHDDHSGGAVAVLERTRIGELVLPAGAKLNPRLSGVVAAARAAGATVREVARGETVLATRRATVAVLGPPPEWGGAPPSENDRSVVLLAAMDGAGVLLTGDVERAGEDRLVSSAGGLAAQVLKVPHHGAASSSTAGLIEAVRPRLAVFSVGARNRYGHPDRAVVERYRACGAEVFRTDRDGAVLVSVEGGCVRGRAIASGRAFELAVYRKTLEPRGPTSTVAARSRSITRRAAARTSSAETASTSAGRRSP
jgi:competence protein ComEC